MESSNVKQQGKKQREQAQPTARKPVSFHEELSEDIARRCLSTQAKLAPVDVLYRLVYGPTNLRSEGERCVKDEEASTLVNSNESSPKVSIDRSSHTSSSDKSTSDRGSSKTAGVNAHTYTLDHFAALSCLQALIEQYNRISHMGILDPSYTFFLNRARSAALYYKVKSKIAVVGGDPLCPRHLWSKLLSEFTHFRRRHALGIAFLGTSDEFAHYATSQKGWVTMRFGTERALNPITNSVLGGTNGKRIVKQAKQLKKEGIKIDIYAPAQKDDLTLQEQLMHVYDTWRSARNDSGKQQAYMTVFDPFALSDLMMYIYTTSPGGQVNGFAGLRRLANGYHIDPCCALPDAPRGISELLIYTALAILNKTGISYLGLGFEPSEQLNEIYGLNSGMEKIVRKGYERTFSCLPISGKKAFHDKWYPDPDYDAGLWLVYPDGQPGLRHSLAMMHFANVAARDILRIEVKDHFKKWKANWVKDTSEEEDSLSDSPLVVDPKLKPLEQSKGSGLRPKIARAWTK